MIDINNILNQIISFAVQEAIKESVAPIQEQLADIERRLANVSLCVIGGPATPEDTLIVPGLMGRVSGLEQASKQGPDLGPIHERLKDLTKVLGTIVSTDDLTLDPADIELTYSFRERVAALVEEGVEGALDSHERRFDHDEFVTSNDLAERVENLSSRRLSRIVVNALNDDDDAREAVCEIVKGIEFSVNVG